MKKSDNIVDVYTLSPLQEGMLFHSIYQKEASAYFVQSAYRLSGNLRVGAVERSLQQLVDRHDILRTSFVYEEMDKPLQVVLRQRTLPFHFEDLRPRGSRQEQEAFLVDYKKEDRKRYFDLTHDCLMRAAVFQLSETEYELIWSCHHIIIDGWCLKTMEEEFFTLYEENGDDAAALLPPAPQYKKYIKWLDEQSPEKSVDYWREYLRDFDAPTGIPRLKPTDGPLPAFNNDIHVYEVPESLNDKLTALAQRNRSTLNSIVRALWGILLAKYNDRKDAIFGAVVSGRPPQLPESEDIVGLFINTVPVRIAYPSGLSFRDLLAEVTRDAVESEAYHYYPLAEIQNLSEQKNQLFDHILVFENYPTNPSLKGLSVESEVKDTNILQLVSESVFSQNHYPFYIIVGTKPRLKFNFFYNKDLYDEAQIRQIAGQFAYLMEQSVSDEGILMDEMALVQPDSAEHRQLVEGFDQTRRDFPLGGSVAEVFSKTAAKFPDRLAVHAAGESYTFAQLDQVSSRLAAYVLEQVPAETEDPQVGILVNRPDYAVITMLAAAKSGMAFVPIHPELPGDNIRNILAETSIAFLCVESSLLQHVGDFSGVLFAADIQMDMLEESEPDPGRRPAEGDPLYVIYSSGTTGQPKGVVISNRSLLNYFHWLRESFDLSPGQHGALLSSYAFDLGYTTIWGCLLSGATLYLPDRKLTREPDALVNYLQTHQVTFLKLTPSHFKILLAASGLKTLRESALQLILLGGEKIVPADIEAFREIKSDTRFVNHYGPTEATIGAIAHRINGEKLEAYRQFPVIGKPIANNQAYILNEAGKLLPVGARGNLYLAGEGLAIGYYRRPELTRERFTESAWGKRIYQTGDKARRFPDGAIEFLGRSDNEVKVRGYRVDMGEIEQVVGRHPAVAFASVQSRENASGEVSLVAYVQLEAETDTQDLAAYLARKLPDFMIPSQLIRIGEVPLTANGKLDVKKLKKVTGEVAQRTVEPPATDTEQKLLDIWKEVLEKEVVSVDDDFFTLGGHSLKAVQVISRVIVVFQVTLEVKDIFDHTTVRALAKEIEVQSGASASGQSFDEITI